MRLLISCFLALTFCVAVYLALSLILFPQGLSIALKQRPKTIVLEDYDVFFQREVSKAKLNLATRTGKEYEAQFNSAISGLDEKCFEWAAWNGGARGYYELVGVISEAGKLTNTMVNPMHRYSNCVLNGASSIEFPRPPAKDWVVYRSVNIIP